MKARDILNHLVTIGTYINSDPECSIAVKLVGKQFDLEEISPKIQKQADVVITRLKAVAGDSNVDGFGNVLTYDALIPEAKAEIDALYVTLNEILDSEHEFNLDISEDLITLGKSVSAYRDMRRLCKKS